MQFPATIRGSTITIPKNVREFAGLESGDVVLVEIISKKETTKLKANLEKSYRKGD